MKSEDIPLSEIKDWFVYAREYKWIESKYEINRDQIEGCIQRYVSDTSKVLYEKEKSMNEELIKQLKEERSKLYPHGCPIQSRGYSKTYLYLSHFLRWHAYDFCCQMLERAVLPINIEYAHKWISDYVATQMPE